MTIRANVRGAAWESEGYRISLPTKWIDGLLRRVAAGREGPRRGEEIGRQNSDQLRLVGSELFERVLAQALQREWSPANGISPGQRLVIESDEQELMRLLWECLYDSKGSGFLATSQRISLVRRVPQAIQAVSGERGSLDRILIVAPDSELAAPRVSGIGVIQMALDESVGLKIEVLQGEDARESSLRHAMDTFTPDVLHYSGHADWTAEARVVLSDVMIPVARLTSSWDGCVRLAVFDTSMEEGGGAALACPVLRTGASAVVVPTGPVGGRASSLFFSVLYRQLGAGDSLEVAIGEARLALELERLSWYSYALYAFDTGDLGSLRLGVQH
jgi:hypothetical protein